MPTQNPNHYSNPKYPHARLTNRQSLFTVKILESSEIVEHEKQIRAINEAAFSFLGDRMWPSDDLMERTRNKRVTVFGAVSEKDSTLCAFLLLEKSSKEPTKIEPSLVAVALDYQKRGLGRLLVTQALNHVITHCPEITHFTIQAIYGPRPEQQRWVRCVQDILKSLNVPISPELSPTRLPNDLERVKFRILVPKKVR